MNEVQKPVPDNALEAWCLWNRLNEYADQLWVTFESEFLEYCIEDTKYTIHNQPLPFD